jgi:hypothetical protein
MYNRILFSWAILGLVLATSCTKDEKETKKLDVPSSYDGSSFTVNAATQIVLVGQLKALTDEAKRGRDASNTLTSAALEALFNQGQPSLSAEVTDYFRGKLVGAGNWFDEIAKSSGTTWTPQAPDGNSQGGVYGAYLFDENGLEIEQLIEKGQFNATFYNHATKLMNGTISLATVDQLLAIFGAKPAFANSGSNKVAAENRDEAMANYGARRDKNDGNGLYAQIKTAFITLQAAVKAGNEFNAERDQAMKDIFVLWEKINAATIINYCHSPIAGLSNTNPTDVQIAGALHAIAEGIGFIQGLKSISNQHKMISDAQIDEVLVLFNAPANGTATVYKFATDPENELPKLQQAIAKLKDIYGFNAQQIEDFKSNWVSVQQR